MLNDQSTFKWTLLPLGLTLLFYGLWRLTQVPLLAWLGVVSAMMGMALPIVALVLELSQSQQTSKSRIQALVIKSALTGISVVLCWSNFQIFSSISSKNTQTTKTIIIKNLSDQPIQNVRLNYAGQELIVKEISGYGKHEAQIQILSETLFKASIQEKDNIERSSQILIGPENKYIQVLIDLQKNIMAEVQ